MSRKTPIVARSLSRLPTAGEGKRGEEGYLGYLLRQASNAYSTRLERALRDLDVTPPQFAAMTMLTAYPGHSSADLARLAFLTPQSMSVIVGNRDIAGHVRRRPHSVHGRIQQLELTESGGALLTRAKQRVYALERKLVEDLGEDEARIVRRWLVGIAKAARG
jgi:DNA-binding MarR family transcriptional regulator